jgi:hypothetical protein
MHRTRRQVRRWSGWLFIRAQYLAGPRIDHVEYAGRERHFRMSYSVGRGAWMKRLGVRAVRFAGDAMRQLTIIATLVVALATPAAARSRLVVLDRPTLACSDQQALEMALTLARLHEGPAFRDHARSYGLHVDRARRRAARGGGRVSSQIASMKSAGRSVSCTRPSSNVILYRSSVLT